MKITKHFTIVFLAIVHCGIAQTSAEAKALLNKVSNRIARQKNISFDFKYVLENKQEQTLQEASGKAIIAGDRYKLHFLETGRFYDGKNVYTVVHENKEIIVSTPEESENFGINPSELLQFYKTGYDCFWDIKQSVFDHDIQFVKLVPDEENKGIQYVLLGVDIRNNSIYKLIEIGKNGTQITVTLSNWREDINLTSEFFTFKSESYPDYYIIK